jgi:RimJ/RimL family protein N-acetyltransferase
VLLQSRANFRVLARKVRTAVLRHVEPGDIPVFFAQERDPVASRMAAFPSRDRAAHEEHWSRVLADDGAIVRTIVEDSKVVGYIGSWKANGERQIGYWIGREYWGRGYATHAVADLLTEVRERPVWARVPDHNIASLRVLAKCGFAVVGAEHDDGAPVREIVLRLSA